MVRAPQVTQDLVQSRVICDKLIPSGFSGDTVFNTLHSYKEESPLKI